MDILPRFYVYVLCQPNGSPFYVGKGQGNRINAHESAARNGYKAKRYSIIRKIWREGGQVGKCKVFATDDQDEAYAVEQALIAAIGRKYLANETDGGDGNHGLKQSDDAKARIAKALTGRKMSPETWARVQAAKIGKPRSEACKAKLREKLTGRIMPDGWIEKVSAANKGKPWSEAERKSIPVSLRVPKPNARGEKHHNSKVTEAQAREVFRLRTEEHLSAKVIADRLGIKCGTVGGMLHSPRDWKWLKDELGYIST